MSYTLEFPRTELPADARKPPYVVFGINSREIPHNDLPFDVPVALALHFAPELKRFVAPPPQNLPKVVKYLQLRKPYVGINILEDITAQALSTIIKRMLQLAGYPGGAQLFPPTPTTVEAVQVIQAWKALELPAGGIRSLETHLFTKMMMGPPVLINDMRAIWGAYPTTAPILREAAMNFIRAHIANEYPSFQEDQMVEAWISMSPERQRFFNGFESQFQNWNPEDISASAFAAGGRPRPRRGSVVLETTGTRYMSSQEQRERYDQDREEISRRLRRLRSDENLRSI